MESNRTAPRPIDDFEERFRDEMSALILERSRLLVWASTVLYLAFWPLDFFVSKEFSLQFLKIRIAIEVMYIGMLLLLYSPRAKRIANPLVIFGAFASASSIALMSALLGGFSSVYFVGILIVMVAVPLIVPIGVQGSIVLSSATIVSYIAINVAAHGASAAMVQPVFFLTGVAMFTLVASVIQYRTLRRNLSLRLRLEAAFEELKELDRAKTRLFANVSHELRTPLTLLLGPLETLVREESDERRLEVFRSMGQNARRLLRQVEALLDIARLQSGRLRLQASDGNLGQQLLELVASAMPHAETRGVRILTDGLDRLPDSIFDSYMTEVIAGNLISNALKFTPRGGSVSVTAGSDVENVWFEVRDTGIGIPETHLQRIFERFYQVESSVSRTQEGTGLGLALARELVRLHGGQITVESEMGEGTVFHVRLPKIPPDQGPERRRYGRRSEDRLTSARVEALATRELANRSRSEALLADIEAPSLAAAEEALPTQAPEGAPRVLVVDDNSDLRNFLARHLGSRYGVETAADGADALVAMHRRRPDLVVSDVMMPGIDGYELCRRAREDPALRNVPVILLTAKAGQDALVEGLEVGADDYVTKPFSLRELDARIAAHLRAKKIEQHLYERDSRLTAIGQLTSSLVHDLKNPLTVIKGYTDLAHRVAVEGGEQQEIAKDLERVLSSAGELQGRIEEILEFARGGTPELALQPVRMRDYLERQVPPIAEELGRWGIDVDFAVQLDPETETYLDAAKMDRALEHLLTNARDAMLDSEEKSISIRAFIEGEHLAVRIADTGKGIDPAVEDKLFEPFATSGKVGGTGLGLATVRNFVTAHGGEITAENRPTGGAAFTMRLPCRNLPVAAVEVAEPAPSAES